MPDKKLTVNVPQETLDQLDEIAKRELFGSRGRTIQALARAHYNAKQYAMIGMAETMMKGLKAPEEKKP